MTKSKTAIKVLIILAFLSMLVLGIVLLATSNKTEKDTSAANDNATIYFYIFDEKNPEGRSYKLDLYNIRSNTTMAGYTVEKLTSEPLSSITVSPGSAYQTDYIGFVFSRTGYEIEGIYNTRSYTGKIGTVEEKTIQNGLTFTTYKTMQYPTKAGDYYIKIRKTTQIMVNYSIVGRGIFTVIGKMDNPATNATLTGYYGDNVSLFPVPEGFNVIEGIKDWGYRGISNDYGKNILEDTKLQNIDYSPTVFNFFGYGGTKVQIVFQPMVSLTLNTNGGKFDDNTTSLSVREMATTTYDLPTPTREGYIFKGWHSVSPIVGDNFSYHGTLLKGNGYNSDPFFTTQTLGVVSRYFPNGVPTSVEHSYVDDEEFKAISPNSSKVLKISSTTPDKSFYGGYTHETQATSGEGYLVIIQAKIPEGYRVNFGSNNIGDARQKFDYANFGDGKNTIGTGEWQIYAFYVLPKSNTGETLGTTNYIYVAANNSADPSIPNNVTYYIGSSAVYDVTGKTFDTKNLLANMGSAETYTFGQSDQTMWAMWEEDLTIPRSLSFDLNGGQVSSNNTAKTIDSISGVQGAKTDLPVPYRSGYRFIGWQASNYDKKAKISNLGILESSSSDPFFFANGFKYIYNNAYNGNVTHTREENDWYGLISPSAKNTVTIRSSLPATPGFGGFSNLTPARPAAEIIVIFQAKLPDGYRIYWGSNSAGDNNTHKWLTPNIGTNDWEIYAHYVKCGLNGNFSNTNFFYVATDSGKDTVAWDVGFCAEYDATGIYSAAQIATFGENSKFMDNLRSCTSTAKYTFGKGDQKLIALWEPDTWDRYAEEPKKDSDNYYEVTTAEELAYFAKKGKTGSISDNIKLMNDIDLSGHEWYPICTMNPRGYSGEFNGQGYTIRNLRIALSVTGYVNAGLFGLGESGSVFKNVNIVGVVSNFVLDKNMTDTWTPTGSLVGQLWRGTIIKCTSNVIMRGNTDVGGLVGKAYASQLSYCTSRGTIMGNSKVGGIVGLATDTTLDNCYNFARMGLEEILGQSVGGIVGRFEILDMTPKINNCKNYMTVRGTYLVGGIVGEYYFSKAKSTPVEMVCCLNEASIYAKHTVGGLIGVINSSDTNVSSVQITASGSYDGSKYTDSTSDHTISSSDAQLHSLDKTYLRTGGLVGYRYIHILILKDIFFIGKIEINGRDLKLTDLTDETDENYGVCFHGLDNPLVRANWDEGYCRVFNVTDNGKVWWDGKNFAGFVQIEGVMGGYPIPRQMFWIGDESIAENKVRAWFDTNGYK